jgi:hypothetical protein
MRGLGLFFLTVAAAVRSGSAGRRMCPRGRYDRDLEIGYRDPTADADTSSTAKVPGGRDMLGVSRMSRFRMEVVVRRRNDVPRPFFMRSPQAVLTVANPRH